MVKAGALGLEGEVKMYESEAAWTLMSRKGSVIVEEMCVVAVAAENVEAAIACDLTGSLTGSVLDARMKRDNC